VHNNKTQFVKNSVIDRQPVQLLQSWSYVVTQAKVENKPSCTNKVVVKRSSALVKL